MRMCAIREVAEETGIVLDHQHLIKLFRVNLHSYYFVYLEERPNVRIDNREITDYRWVPFSECESLKIGTTMRRAIEQIISHMQK